MRTARHASDSVSEGFQPDIGECQDGQHAAGARRPSAATMPQESGHTDRQHIDDRKRARQNSLGRLDGRETAAATQSIGRHGVKFPALTQRPEPAVVARPSLMSVLN